jgi:hypothetical protein
MRVLELKQLKYAKIEEEEMIERRRQMTEEEKLADDLRLDAEARAEGRVLAGDEEIEDVDDATGEVLGRKIITGKLVGPEVWQIEELGSSKEFRKNLYIGISRRRFHVENFIETGFISDSYCIKLDVNPRKFLLLNSLMSPL